MGFILGWQSNALHTTFRALQDTQARAARRFVILGAPLGSESEAVRFLPPGELAPVSDLLDGELVVLRAGRSLVAMSGERTAVSVVSVAIVRYVNLRSWSSMDEEVLSS